MPPALYGVEPNEHSPDIWLPITTRPQVMMAPTLLKPDGLFWIHTVARRNAAISAAQAQSRPQSSFSGSSRNGRGRRFRTCGGRRCGASRSVEHSAPSWRCRIGPRTHCTANPNPGRNPRHQGRLVWRRPCGSLTLITAVVILSAALMSGSLIPAHRAKKINPMVALRCE
jgi:hypothetical protein